MLNLAYFISPHGFGHASRSVAVMQSLLARSPHIHFHIFTLVPGWFFEDALPASCFTLHKERSDIGLVQRSPLEEDLPATISALHQYFPFQPELLSCLAASLVNCRCQAVLCDIAPLGIAAAQAAGIPSILIENFTWDWIYEGYLSTQPAFAQIIPGLAQVFRQADHHIQTQPLCQPSPAADLTTHPVSRRPKNPPSEVRNRLGIKDNNPAVLITMGGIPEKYAALDQLRRLSSVWFILPGSSDEHQIQDNLVLLPHRSAFYHPDLVNASQAVIGKLGYSTISEVYHAGLAFGYIPRDQFRESPLLSAYVDQNFNAICISDQDFYSGKWLTQLDALLSAPRMVRAVPNGADQISEFILKRLSAQSL